MVSRVEQGSPAAEADIADGDVIVSADRTAVTSVEQLREAAATAAEEDRPLLLRVYKDGAYSYVPVELDSV
ncbi:PDZ domain-containing protein [Silicimonas algicola]|uniref:PDZ domain-containing protein n=1 Tax=Silicimonas algicola TaxID=1826607 RepID=UPI0024AE9D60|nr:PDZ domain-containing protein [Silicimonas algicola]